MGKALGGNPAAESTTDDWREQLSEYDNTNRGAIYVNDRKESDNHPDRTGSLNVGGVDYWISGWLKKDKNGKAYMSLSVKPKEQKQAEPPKRQAPRRNDDDDVPF